MADSTSRSSSSSATDTSVHDPQKWIQSLKDFPLHEAARNGDLAVLRLLLDSGTDLEARDYNRETPLHAAVLSGQADAVQLLLVRGANTEALGPMNTDNCALRLFTWPPGMEGIKLLDCFWKRVRTEKQNREVAPAIPHSNWLPNLATKV